MIDRRSEVLVLLREVRDPRPPVRLEVGGAGVRENGLRRLVNPADLTALEVALRLAEHGGGAVTAVAIGDERLDDALRLALAVGAGRAVRVWDDAMRDGDAAADATVLQRVLEIVRPALFVSGHRLLDRGDDPAAALAAARFGMPCVGAALSCALRGDEVDILRKADKGASASARRCPAPCSSTPPPPSPATRTSPPCSPRRRPSSSGGESRTWASPRARWGSTARCCALPASRSRGRTRCASPRPTLPCPVRSG